MAGETWQIAARLWSNLFYPEKNQRVNQTLGSSLANLPREGGEKKQDTAGPKDYYAGMPGHHYGSGHLGWVRFGTFEKGDYPD
jgi:hypothetical protein